MFPVFNVSFLFFFKLINTLGVLVELQRFPKFRAFHSIVTNMVTKTIDYDTGHGSIHDTY